MPRSLERKNQILRLTLAIGHVTRQGMGVTGGVPFGFNIGVKDGQAGGTLEGIDLVGLRGNSSGILL